jgi:O-antigen/teichoic acid export membrane protein
LFEDTGYRNKNIKTQMLNKKLKVQNIKTLIQNSLKNPLLSGSMVMVFGTNLSNFLAYLYHVVFGRLLSLESYGTLAATLAFIGFVSSAVTFFSIVIVKFVSAADAKHKESLLQWFFRKSLYIGIIVCFISIIATPMLSSFLHINPQIIFLAGPIFLITLLSLVFKSHLQGILKFTQFVVVLNTEMLGRLLFGLVFVYLGWDVFGAITGLFVSLLVGAFLGKMYLRDHTIWKIPTFPVDTKKIASYSLPILISSFATNSLLSSDVLLIKHFFEPRDAGIYASIATIGKIVFYAAAPLNSVMFPMVSQKHANGEKYMKVFLSSIGLTLAMSLSVLMLFLIIPHFIVGSLYGDRYADASANILWYGIFMTFFTLSSLVLNFFLSIGKTKLVFVALFAAVAQIAGIWFYHDSLFSVIQISTVVSVLFFVTLLLYFGITSKLDTNKVKL